MKIVAAPNYITPPKLIDFFSPAEGDRSQDPVGDYHAAFNDYVDTLAATFRDLGYRSHNTGKVASFSVGDGAALYMLLDPRPSSDREPALMHLPYVDGYSYPYAARLTKKDVLENVAWSNNDMNS